MLAAGAALVARAATACSDDSTASAPLTSQPGHHHVDEGRRPPPARRSTDLQLRSRTEARRQRDRAEHGRRIPASRRCGRVDRVTNAPSTRHNSVRNNGGQDSRNGEPRTGSPERRSPERREPEHPYPERRCHQALPRRTSSSPPKRENCLRASNARTSRSWVDTDNNVALTMGAYICSGRRAPIR